MVLVTPEIPNHGLFLYTFKFPIVKVRLRPKPPSWNLGCIYFKVLLVGPWPWAPHQKTKYNNIQKFTVHLGFTWGTLHPPPLRYNTVLGVHDFGQSPFFFVSSFLFCPSLTSSQISHCSRPAVFLQQVLGLAHHFFSTTCTKF